MDLCPALGMPGYPPGPSFQRQMPTGDMCPVQTGVATLGLSPAESLQVAASLLEAEVPRAAGAFAICTPDTPAVSSTGQSILSSALGSPHPSARHGLQLGDQSWCGAHWAAAGTLQSCLPMWGWLGRLPGACWTEPRHPQRAGEQREPGQDCTALRVNASPHARAAA